MTVTIITVVAVLIGLGFTCYLTGAIERNKQHRVDMAELERWRLYWQESRRWLAEFQDVADALDHLEAMANGIGDADIWRTRAAMRMRRDMIEKRTANPVMSEAEFGAYQGLTAKAAAAREADFRVAYQHLGAECDGCEDAPLPGTFRAAYPNGPR